MKMKSSGTICTTLLFSLMCCYDLVISTDTNIVLHHVSNEHNVDDSQQSVIISNGVAKIITKDGERILNGNSFRIVNGIYQDLGSKKTNVMSENEDLEKDKLPTLEDVTRELEEIRKEPRKEIEENKNEEETAPLMAPVRLFDPMDARRQIAKYNRFMKEIFERMNAAIKLKSLDPMELDVRADGVMDIASTKIRNTLWDPSIISEDEKKQDGDKILILTPPDLNYPKPKPITSPIVAEEDDDKKDEDKNTLSEAQNKVKNVKGYLYGMSTLTQSGDVTIFFRNDHRTIQVPFSLGPLELKVVKTIGSGRTERTKTAKATTDLMLGLMDVKIDLETGQAEITKVIFDQPGDVNVSAGIKRTINNDEGKVKARKKSFQTGSRLKSCSEFEESSSFGCISTHEANTETLENSSWILILICTRNNDAP